MKPLLLLTGGTGTVGSLLLEKLRQDFRLRITLLSALGADAATRDDELMVGNLLDASFAERCVSGVKVVIHLAANAAPSCSAQEAMGNVEIAANVFAAAAEAGVTHVVVASSVHASGLDYRDEHLSIRTAAIPRPCCPYGAGKIAVEALARLYQDKAQNAVSCLRLGLTGWPLKEKQYAHMWLSEQDLLPLIQAAITRQPGFGVYNAVSLDSAPRWDLSNADQDLNWRPTQRWPVDVSALPMATSCTCNMFTP